VSRDWRLYVEDTLDSTRKIQRYVAGLSRGEFVENDQVFDAVVRNLEIIGEAAKHLDPEVRARMPNIEWRRIVRFRDVIAHHYFGLDVDIIWDVVSMKLADLQSTCLVALASADERHDQA
jgi:uncharacterized protein with HEPN domain